MKNKIVYSLISFLIMSCSIGQKKPTSIEEKIESALDRNNVPSLSIGVVRNGNIDLLTGFGTKSREDVTDINEKSIFQIASQSKMFTGIIVNNLIQEGKLNLNEVIIAYFPTTISEETKKRLGKIKLKNILNHTSGIPSNACSVYSERINGNAWTKGYSKQQIVKDINMLTLEFEPGTQFQYSNSGYAIVGYICEAVSGLNYNQLLKKYVANEYGLKNTVINLNDKEKSLLVTPYRKDDREVKTQASIMGMATPASAIYSNATDLSKILVAQIKAYQLYEKKNIQSPLILTTQSSKMDDNLRYGFGLIKSIDDENEIYGHGGDADGFACEYFFNPQKNTGVVILTSSGGRWVGELANQILNDLK